MNNWICLFIFSLSLSTFSQSSEDFNQINIDYENFITPIIQENQNSKTETHPIIRGELPLNSFNISNSSTISIEETNQSLTKNQQAVILYSIFSNVTYEFVADLYNSSQNKNSITNKDLLKLNISYGPDTSILKTPSTQKINKHESISQYNLSTTKKLEAPIEIYFFTSTQEVNNRLGKTYKLLININSKTVYEAVKKGNSISINRKKGNPHFGQLKFEYSSEGSRLEANGGLFNYLLFKRLEEISHNVMFNSTLIKNVNDVKDNLNKGITRSISKGTTTSKAINLKSYITPKHDPIQTLEVGDNEEQIIEWYSKHQKKSQIQLNNQILNGPAKNWAINGNLIMESNYLNGKLHGDYQEFYDDLTPKIITRYKNGKIVSNYKTYHQNGILKQNINYRRFHKHGYSKEYHANGKLKFKGRYKKSQPHGWHIFYDQNGNPIKKNKYRRGILKRTKVY